MASNNGHKASEMFKGQVHLYKHLFAHIIDAMSLKWMVELGIADIIHNMVKPLHFQSWCPFYKLHQLKLEACRVSYAT